MVHPESAQDEDTPSSSPEPDAARALATCLLASFSAENHDSLSDEITRLLLHLSHD